MRISTDYSGRQLDLEVLVHPPDLVHGQAMLRTSAAPRVVTGIQKLVQRYAILFLSEAGDDPFDPVHGSSFVPLVTSGTVGTIGHARNIFADANLSVAMQMRIETEGLPPDETLESATLLDLRVDFQTSTVYLQVLITSAAGSSVEFTLPVEKAGG